MVETRTVQECIRDGCLCLASPGCYCARCSLVVSTEIERLEYRVRALINGEQEVENENTIERLREALGGALTQLEILEWSGDYNSCPSCNKTDPFRMEDYRLGQSNNRNFDESAFGHSWPYGQCPVEKTIGYVRAALHTDDSSERAGNAEPKCP